MKELELAIARLKEWANGPDQLTPQVVMDISVALTTAQSVLTGKRVYWCEMMKRLVSEDEMKLGNNLGGECYWDGDECEGGWRRLIEV